jgi:hypothetical protein
MRKRLLGPAFAWLALAACTGRDTSNEGATARADASTARADASSSAVVDCGTFNLSQGEGLPDSAFRCFIEAVQARRPARLKETRPTIEGDPIPVTYVATADGRVQVTTDTRQDHFGNQGITRKTCTGPTAAEGWLRFAQCSEPAPVRS